MKQKNATADVAPAEAGAPVVDERPDAPPFDPTSAPEVGDAPTPPEFTEAAPASEKSAFTGEWQCSVCGGAITSLPFQPRSTANLKCIECFKQSKG